MKKFLIWIMSLFLCGTIILSGCAGTIARSASNSYANIRSGNVSYSPKKQEPSSKQNNGINHKSLASKTNRLLSPEELVRQIVARAKKGQNPDFPFAVKQTALSKVEKTGSKPDAPTKDASNGKSNVQISYRKGSTVADARSANEEIRQIRLDEIKKVMGEADQIRFNKNDNQEVLVYDLNDKYELNWVINKPSPTQPNPNVDHISIVVLNKMNAILNKMTLDEKIGQMMMIGLKDKHVGSFEKNALVKEHIGGVILYSRNIGDSTKVNQFINQLKSVNETAGNPLPLFVSVDQEGGRVQRLPSEIHSLPSNGKIGKINDPHFSYQIGQVIGKEMSAFGFNMDYAPVLDINIHGAGSVIGDRSFGSNKKVVSRLGVATMKGIESQQVISVIKHFPGYGAVQANAHKVLPKVDENLNDLMSVEWYPYERAIANGADAVMVTHMVIPSLDRNNPASMSKTIITNMLRGKLGFDGVVITDDLTMAAIESHYNVAQAAVKSVKAGADIVMIAFKEDQQEAVFQALKQAVQDGEIPMKRINESVSRIIRLKQKYHLSDASEKPVNIDKLNQDIQAVLGEKLP